MTVWFDGTINLDGSIPGHSMVAAAGTAPKCNALTTECGFVEVPAVIRFNARTEADGTRHHVAELWFQQDKWIKARPFVR